MEAFREERAVATGTGCFFDAEFLRSDFKAHFFRQGIERGGDALMR